MELFRRLDEPSDSPIGDSTRIEAVMARATEGLTSALSTPSTLHGLRAQGMFESLVVALDGCELLTTVDHGQVFHDGDSVKPADFLIVLRDRRRLLVDVKALSPKRVGGDASMSAAEWRGLRRYGELMDADVYLAFLVTAFQTWALVPLSTFPEPVGTARTRVPVTQLIVANEMYLLGDIMLGIEPPLRMDLVADSTRPRPARTDDGELTEVEFMIGSIEFTVGGRQLTGKREKDLAYFLLMFGQWDVEHDAVVDDGQVERLVFEARPTEPESRQNFEIIGALSSMYTRWFDLATSDRDGNVQALDTTAEPGMLPTLVPHDWESDELHLLRLVVRPDSNEPSGPDHDS